MVLYRRHRVAGGAYFFTVTLCDRRASTLVDHIETLREAVRQALRKRPFHIDAWVVLPDHLHALWTLPAGDDDYAGRWRFIKARFTRQLVCAGVPLRRNARGEYALWQRRFWEHTLRDDGDFSRHANYVHYNPVKHGLVSRVGDWPYSTFHRYVRQGLYPADWGSAPTEYPGNYGE